MPERSESHQGGTKVAWPAGGYTPGRSGKMKLCDQKYSMRKWIENRWGGSGLFLFPDENLTFALLCSVFRRLRSSTTKFLSADKNFNHIAFLDDVIPADGFDKAFGAGGD